MPVIPASVIATIDFEGSSLHGYPIEVGVALWDRVADEICVWSTLIRPIPYWRKNPMRWWNARSEAVHGITPDALEAGLHPREVMIRLNALLVDRQAFCDGVVYDKAFLARLSDAAGSRPAFGLGDLEALCVQADLDDLGYLRMCNLLDESRTSVEHRAGSDALRLLRAVTAAADRSPSLVADSAFPHQQR